VYTVSKQDISKVCVKHTVKGSEVLSKNRGPRNSGSGLCNNHKEVYEI